MMDIYDAVRVFAWEHFFWDIVKELRGQYTSPRRRQEIWVFLRHKLMIELLSFPRPVTEIMQLFQQLSKAYSRHRDKYQSRIPQDLISHKLEALLVVYNYLTRLSDEEFINNQ